MCVDHMMICKCGSKSASFNFKDEIMPVEVVECLYCPQCSGDINYDADTMIRDNGWIIKYDMEIAKFMRNRLPAKEINPSFIFDEGYCTWRGVYPNDHIDSVEEREELLKLSKINPKKYIEEFRKWGIERMDRLSREGWRKANAA